MADWKKIFIDLRAIKYDSAKLFLRGLENTLDLAKWINEGIDAGEINSNPFTLNTLTADTQTFATGTTGTDFGISSSGSTHTFNLPIASSTNTGKLSASDWTLFNSKLGDADNGLAATLLGKVQLGGALTKNTSITGSYNFQINPLNGSYPAIFVNGANNNVCFGTSVAGSASYKVNIEAIGTASVLFLKNTTASLKGGVAFTADGATVYNVGNYGASHFFMIGGSVGQGFHMAPSGSIALGLENPNARLHVNTGSYADTTIAIFENSVNSKAWHVTTSGGVIAQSWFNKSPIAQPTTAYGSATFVANSGTAVNTASTFGGYTIGQIAKALIDLGFLA